jgi:hypothetical protein
MRPDKKVIRNADIRQIDVSLLITLFENSFPHFHNAACYKVVDAGGKPIGQIVIRKRATISTTYPQ